MLSEPAPRAPMVGATLREYIREEARMTTKERPILFSGAMVRAILDGTKTQTRRVVTNAKPYEATDEGIDVLWLTHALSCPYGAPGERLWVRETWAASLDSDGDMCEPIIYRASHDETLYGPLKASFSDRATENWDVVGNTGWRPSIHMPRAYSRITLEITGVRVERVQDISEADAQAEGFDRDDWPRMHRGVVLFSAREAYSYLWDDINAARGYGWERNPWVWVVEFRRLFSHP